MRPQRLTMKAFGSFAEETVISFEEFESGIFLVIGETGAGKTTIFDAIVFALFGTASGSNRKPEMMHSDYAEKSEETLVSLSFRQTGKEYLVERTIRFPKKRGDGGYGEAKFDAALTGDGLTPVTGATKVTKRIEELLGLSAEQFRKIVMLAQGEFREFLASDSAKKSEILAKLFDTSEYARYQALISGARDSLALRRRDCEGIIRNAMGTMFLLPPGEEDDGRFLPGNAALSGNLEELIGRERASRDAILQERKRNHDTIAALNAKKGAAEGNNRKLSELSGERKKLDFLLGKAEEMEQTELLYSRAERALHGVMPFVERRDAAERLLDRTKKEIGTLTETSKRQEESAERARAEVRADEAQKDRTAELAAGVRELQAVLPVYGDLAARREKLAGTREKHARLRKDIAAKEEAKTRGGESLGTMSRELALLDNAGADAARADADYRKLRERNEAFRGAGSLPEQLRAIRAKGAEIRRESENLSVLAGRAAEAERRHHELYQLLLSGQAGILGEALEEELLAKGRAACPVCGAGYRAGEPHRFAVRVNGTPTQKQVDDARKAFDRAEAERAGKQNDITAARAEMETRKQALLAAAARIIPEAAAFEDIAAEGFLEDVERRFLGEEEAARKVLADMLGRVEKQKRLKESTARLEAELEALGRQIETARGEDHALELEEASLTAEIEGIAARLKFPTSGEARAELERLLEEKKRLEDAAAEHRRRLEAEEGRLQQILGALRNLNDSLPGLAGQAENASRELMLALARHGFASEEAYREAAALTGETDGESWLKEQSRQINEYRNDLGNVRGRIRTLEEETAGLAYTDLSAMEQEIAAAETERNEIEKRLSGLNRYLENHILVSEKVGAARAGLSATDASWKLLEDLADLAQGASGEGGKLSFERYVMGAFFRDILEMANRRLDVMSGGRYLLEHAVNVDRKNTVAGLEIMVRDAVTGTLRPAGSLSGGESFQVSLSLALGLSDVVQSHAGGIGLDTIFIDEGFGSLDSGALDQAIAVLLQLTEGNRLVGIISHVDKLEESIPQKLRVSRSPKGSTLETVLA